MEHSVGAEIQINSELAVTPDERAEVFHAVTLLLRRATGGPVPMVKMGRDRIAVQVPREALEEAAKAECPEMVERRRIVFHDPRP